MNRKFSTVKNLILLIASALTLVAVTFAWYAISNVGSFETPFKGNVRGSTISTTYYQSTNGQSYTQTNSDLTMNNLVEGSKMYYRIDVKTSRNIPVNLQMSFTNLPVNDVSRVVYFDYQLFCEGIEQNILQRTGLKMTDYANNQMVFSHDISSLQSRGYNNFYIIYNVYVKSGGVNVSGSSSLGSIKITGQQK